MGNRQGSNRMDERTMTMRSDQWLLAAMVTAFIIGGATAWIIDYHNYHSIVTELLTKCGEPCL